MAPGFCAHVSVMSGTRVLVADPWSTVGFIRWASINHNWIREREKLVNILLTNNSVLNEGNKHQQRDKHHPTQKHRHKFV